MILYPPAKINLGLYITGKRSDGFHNIESLFFQIGLTDILEFLPSQNLSDDELNISGFPIPGKHDSNLLLKACSKFREAYPIPFMKMHLHKRIPMGAGLGGGSSDASLLLKGVNDYFSKGASKPELAEMALSLGSDCPFFLESGSAIGTGRGEILKSFEINLKGYLIYLFHPKVHVSTKDAFSEVQIEKPSCPLEEVLERPIGEWRATLVNNFESSVFKRYPEVRRLKEDIYEAGAVYAAMSGSGSAVYGLFETTPELNAALSEILVWKG